MRAYRYDFRAPAAHVDTFWNVVNRKVAPLTLPNEYHCSPRTGAVR